MTAKYQPVNTAPHGKRILVSCNGESEAVASFERLSVRQSVYGWVNQNIDGKNILLVTDPTHWMDVPKPKLPKAAKAKTKRK